MMGSALGTPVGNFTIYRCNDGRVYNPKLPCRELSQAVHWIKKHLQQNFLSMNAAYGIGYPLTGAEQYFDRMQQGIAFIRQQVWGDSNSLSSYRLAANQKPTSQDLAHV
ncbi:MAG: hypothetical protein SVR94_17225 [Pseudomonadota bacterium]|nr:hypothetical protein [Pseudomonadota bacterium]